MLTHCYEILKVQQTCDNNQLKKAYHRLAKMTHPDKLKDFIQDDERAKKIGARAFRKVTDAYNFILNQRKKRAPVMRKAINQIFSDQPKDHQLFGKPSKLIQYFRNFDDMPNYNYSKHLDILDSLASKLNAMQTQSLQKQSGKSKFSDEDFYLF